MDFPGVGYGQNDLFTYQAKAFLDQVAGLEGVPPTPSFEHGVHNLRLLDAVAESAAAGGTEVTIKG
jgi:predicted dehydrogenase